MRLQLLIPVAGIVSTCLTFSVVWWAWQRRKEREAYYRYELSRLMMERYGDGADRVPVWLREQEAGDERRRREALRLTALVLGLGGAGALVALRGQTLLETAWGWVPIGVGLGIGIWLLLSRERAGR